MSCDGYTNYKNKKNDDLSTTIVVPVLYQKLTLSKALTKLEFDKKEVVYGLIELKSSEFYDAEDNKFTIELLEYFETDVDLIQ